MFKMAPHCYRLSEYCSLVYSVYKPDDVPMKTRVPRARERLPLP